MCRRCEDLEERVAWLESELASEVSSTALHDVQRAFGLSPSKSQILLALYRARGRAVSKLRLEEDLPTRSGDERTSTNILSVYVSRIHAELGHGLIENVWGEGYRLTTSGRDLVARAIGETPAPIVPDNLSHLLDEPTDELRTLAALVAGILAHRDGDGGTACAKIYRRIADRLDRATADRSGMSENAAIRILKAEQVRLMEGRVELIAAADDPRIPGGVIIDQIKQTDRESAEIAEALQILETFARDRAA